MTEVKQIAGCEAWAGVGWMGGWGSCKLTNNRQINKE